MAKADLDKEFDVSAESYFEAVSQFEQYPKFVDGMKSVRVEDGEGGKKIGHYEFSMMGKDMTYSLAIETDPSKHEISWVLDSSDFFKVNNGSWRIESLGDKKCKVNYSLEVEFSFSVPSFMLKTVVKSTLPSMMNNFHKRAQELDSK